VIIPAEVVIRVCTFRWSSPAQSHSSPVPDFGSALFPMERSQSRDDPPAEIADCFCRGRLYQEFGNRLPSSRSVMGVTGRRGARCQSRGRSPHSVRPSRAGNQPSDAREQPGNR